MGRAKATPKKPTRKRKSNAGRPTVMTPEVLRKLEEAFAWGCSDTEACLHADISTTALYDYQAKNLVFTERKTRLKERPIMLARKSVVERLPRDPDLSLKFLERKKKDEFSLRSELTGKDGSAIKTQDVAVMDVADGDKPEAGADSGDDPPASS